MFKLIDTIFLKDLKSPPLGPIVVATRILFPDVVNEPLIPMTLPCVANNFALPLHLQHYIAASTHFATSNRNSGLVVPWTTPLLIIQFNHCHCI